MTTAGSIVVDLLMKTGSFETDSKRAEARAKAMAREIEKAGLIIGGALATATLATVAWTKASIDAADEAIKQAQSVGLLVEQYTALTYAGNLSGVAQEEMAGALTLLSRRAKDAADGSKEAADSFDALGIKVTKPSGALKATNELLAELADRFAAMPDSTEKTALATEILGRSGAKLIPLLNGGAEGLRSMAQEAQALGVVIDTQVAKQAEQFNDNLTRLGELARGTGNDLAREFLPLLVDASDLFVDMGKSARDSAGGLDVVGVAVGGATVALQTLLVLFSDVQFVLQASGRELGAWAAQIGVALEFLTTKPSEIIAKAPEQWRRFRAISDAVREDGERARAELDAFQARVMNLGRNLAQPGTGGAGGASGGRPGGRTGGKPTTPLPPLPDLTPQAVTAVNSLNTLGDVVIDLGDSFFKARTPAEELAAGFDQIQRAALGMDLTPVVAKVDEVDARFIKLGDNIQDAIGTTLYQSLKGDFDNILDLWVDLLIRMAAEAAAADLATALGLGGKGATGGNLSTLISGLGSIFGLGPGRAGGGPVQRGTLHPVNEMGGAGELLSSGGRQYLLPARDGRVSPLTDSLPSYYSGGKRDININVRNLQGQSADVSARPTAGGGLDIEVMIKKVIMDDVASGGDIDQLNRRMYGLSRAPGLARRG